jgi:fused signal recognition particle receptor
MKGKRVFERLKQGLEGIIDKITKTELKENKLEPILWELKLLLLENDVAYSVAERLCNTVSASLNGMEIGRFEDIEKLVTESLREAVAEILQTEKTDLLKSAAIKRSSGDPLVLVFVGINGSGKTTTIAKIAHFLIQERFSVVLACSDTYRAGSIEQLVEHGRRLGIRVIRHQYGSDAAAVAYDTVNYARSNGIDVVLIDTAGRMQTNTNLMEEMRKIVRVVQPDITVFVGDALSGNDAVTQAEEFSKHVKINGSILTKVDADVKGGSAISVVYVTGKPILYLGVGQGYEDLIQFKPEIIIDRLFA